MKSRRSKIRRAAAILEEFAHSLFDAHTVGGEWILDGPSDRRAKKDHDEMLRLASYLRQLASQPLNPLSNSTGVTPCYSQT
jgi:hypothetical protein